MKFAVLIPILLAAFPVMASSDLPAPVVDALRKSLPHHEPNRKYIEMGDLNNDGVVEIATLLGDPDYNEFKENDSAIRIVILSGNPSEGFKVLTSSPELPRDTNVFYFLRVKNQSLYLLTSGRGFTLDYQFTDRHFNHMRPSIAPQNSLRTTGISSQSHSGALVGSAAAKKSVVQENDFHRAGCARHRDTPQSACLTALACHQLIR